MKEGGETLERGPKGPRERVSEESPIPGPAYVPDRKPGPGSWGGRHNQASVCSWPALGHSGHGQSGLRKESAGRFKTGVKLLHLDIQNLPSWHQVCALPPVSGSAVQEPPAIFPLPETLLTQQ